MSEIEKIVRKHFQRVNKEGLGFLETEIIKCSKALEVELSSLIEAKMPSDILRKELIKYELFHKNKKESAEVWIDEYFKSHLAEKGDNNE